MIVSHFELIYKPQSPNAPAGTAAVDNLIQGYFLEITNLSDKRIEYGIAFKTVSVTDPNRSLGGNTLFILDRPGADNQFGRLNGSTRATTFAPSTGRIELEPNETALVALLPSAFGPIPGIDTTPLTAPTFEVRGVVELTVPSLFGPPPVRLFDRSVPQSDMPVQTLVTPQNRTTYFDASGAISDQTQASLPISTGAALLEIEPAPSRRFLDDLIIADRFGPVFEFEPFFAGLQQRDMIAGLLASMDPSTADLQSINKTLASEGIGFAVERRTIKATEPAE